MSVSNMGNQNITCTVYNPMFLYICETQIPPLHVYNPNLIFTRIQCNVNFKLVQPKYHLHSIQSNVTFHLCNPNTTFTRVKPKYNLYSYTVQCQFHTWATQISPSRYIIQFNPNVAFTHMQCNVIITGVLTSLNSLV